LRVIGNGLPVQIELSPGQMNDAPMAELLLKDLPAGAEVIADKDTMQTGQGSDRGPELHPTHPAEIKPLRRHYL
jgi:hypothetical protein